MSKKSAGKRQPQQYTMRRAIESGLAGRGKGPSGGKVATPPQIPESPHSRSHMLGNDALPSEIDAALEWQYHLSQKITQSYLDEIMMTATSMWAVREGEPLDKGVSRETALIIAKVAASALDGELYYISQPISTLLDEAGRSLPIDVKFTADLLPTKFGFVAVGGSVTLYDSRDNEHTNISLEGFAWGTATWAKENAEWEHAGRKAMIIYGMLGVPKTVSGVPGYIVGGGDRGMLMLPLALLEDEQTVTHFNYLNDPDLTKWAAYMPYYAMAFLLFIKQTVLTTSSTRASRGLRRRMEKAGARRPDPLVRVVQLRKHKHAYTHSDGDQEQVDWSCRWLVQGHWRNQWYSSKQIHQPIWIAPFIKGPDDKPLKTPANRVFAVVR